MGEEPAAQRLKSFNLTHVSTPTGVLRRKCACGGSLGLDDECDDCRQHRLTLQPPLLQTKPLVSQPGDRYEQEADRAAEQVASGRESLVSPADSLSSSEPSIQRQPASEDAKEEAASSAPVAQVEPAVEPVSPGAAPASEPAATTEVPAGEPQSGALIVEDDTSPGPGQMSKSAFLDELRTSACAVADAELAAVGRSTEGCPYIERWISYYRTKDSSHVERAIRKYAPETASVTSARDYIPLVNERIRQGVARWAQTGDLSGVPAELLSQASGAGLLSGIGSAVSSAVGSLGGLFFKAREGGAKETDPQTIQAQLRSGHPLDGSVRTRMESAFGYDFSRVRVHTDGQAANLSASLNARAFTVGSDVAFGAGEYQPGTLVGDALLAHELAHVVQQGGAASTEAPLQKGGAYTALEEDADQSAVGAVVSLWSGAKGGLAHIAQHAMPQLKSGLRLSRCKSGGATSTSALPTKTVTVNVTYLKDGSTDLATHLSKANDVYKQASVEVKAGKSETLDETKSKAILGNDLILDEYSDPTSPTTEEKELLKANRSSGTITMYYVKGMSQGSLGEAFWPATGQPASFVYASTTSRTWPHELGHVLLDSGDHPSDVDNFMAQTAVASGKELMTADQIKIIRGSAFVK